MMTTQGVNFVRQLNDNQKEDIEMDEEPKN